MMTTICRHGKKAMAMRSTVFSRLLAGSSSNTRVLTPTSSSSSLTMRSLMVVRSHNTAAASAAKLSPLLPTTQKEPRLPANAQELSERLQPLADLWGLDDDRYNGNEHCLSPSSLGSSGNLDKKNRLLSVLSLPLPGEEGWDAEETKAILTALYTAANVVSTRHHEDKVHYRGLLEFSNICKSDCNYCGIRRSIRQQTRYRLKEAEIMEVAHWANERQYGSIMLQSGEVQTKHRLRFLCRIIRRIVQETGLGVSLSVGELPDDYYQQLFDAGAKRYLLRIETSNPELFASLHPSDQTFESRLGRLRTLKKTGFMLGTGVMIGLPGQTREDLANDVLFFQQEEVDMIGMGPYILQRGTPTGDLWEELHPELSRATRKKEDKTATPQELQLLDTHHAGMFELTTRMVALSRILLGDVNIAATTALQTIHPTGREVALMRGANIMMPILTPTSHRAHYQLYEGKVCVEESAKQCRACLEGRVAAAGKRIAYGEEGDPPSYLRRHRATHGMV